MNQTARIDKWLWAVRLYKTRTLAADACKNNRISINGNAVKPSKEVKVGDTINVRKPPVTYTFKVLQAIEKRVGAKLLPDILENITPPEALDVLTMQKNTGFINRAKGLGRPTKKDRRTIEDFTSTYENFDVTLSFNPFEDDDE